MDFEWTEEQQALQGTLRAFLDAFASESDLRRILDAPTGDADLWKRLSHDLGLPGIAIPEAYGGTGCSMLELVVVQQELGRSLACTPYFSSVALAASALLESGDEGACERWLPSIASGDLVATLAIAEDSGRWDAESIETSATQHGDAWRLSGHKHFVTDGGVASLLLIAARTADGIGLFAVEGAPEGLSRTALDAIDGSRKLSRLGLRDLPAIAVGRPGDAGIALDRTLDIAAVALAAEQMGGAQRVLDRAVAYATDRTQFGRPVGSFQAVKHACADMLLQVEATRIATCEAAWALSEGREEAPALASLAQAHASDAFVFVAEQAIQVLGGIGFTWDDAAHLYLRRARSSQMLLGDPTFHRARMIERLDFGRR